MLVYYSNELGLRTWEIADLTAKHQHSINGSKLILQDMRDRWVMSQNNELLFWVPIEHRRHLYMPPSRVVIDGSQISTVLDLSNSRFGRKWTECIDKNWLRDLKRKEKEVGNLLE